MRNTRKNTKKNTKKNKKTFKNNCVYTDEAKRLMKIIKLVKSTNTKTKKNKN